MGRARRKRAKPRAHGPGQPAREATRTPPGTTTLPGEKRTLSDGAQKAVAWKPEPRNAGHAPEQPLGGELEPLARFSTRVHSLKPG